MADEAAGASTSEQTSASGTPKGGMMQATLQEAAGETEQPTEGTAADAAASDKVETNDPQDQGERVTEPDEGKDGDQAEAGQLKALQAEREKRQALERKLAERDAEDAARRVLREEEQRKATQKQAPRPDPDLDPDEHQRWVQQTTAVSKNNAIGQHGALAVYEAEAAIMAAMNTGDLSPETHQRIDQSDDPFAEVVKWHQDRKRQASMSSIQSRLEEHGGDLDALIAAEVAKAVAGKQIDTAQAAIDSQTPSEPARKTPITPDMSRAPGGGGKKQEAGPVSSFMRNTMSNA